jgi:hypothetical protein
MYGSALEAPMSATANLDLQATIAPDLLARLQALAEKQGISLDDALGQAVGLAEIVQEAKHEPNSDVYIVRNGRRFRVNFQ